MLTVHWVGKLTYPFLQGGGKLSNF